MHCKLYITKKILPNFLEGKCGCHLGEFSHTSFVVFGAEKVNSDLGRFFGWRNAEGNL